MNQSKPKDMRFSDLICPYCHDQLMLQEEMLLCNSCKRRYPMINDIPNFCRKKEYWCNVSRETMQKLNAKAQESGDWLTAAKELIPEYLDHIEPFDRADAQFLWPTTSDSRILDAGSMWGGLTIPVAQYCGEIFAIDKTLETLSFLKIRADQMGFKNVHVVASPLHRLPFPDGYFDMVILSGVLEWVAFDQEVTLEVHWGKKRNDSATYSKNPRQVQLGVLREIQRVLKPGGYLHLAIENKIGFQYLAGQPDDHVNIKYVSFLPRFIANAITKWKLNCEYRTYIYSLPGYRSLLRDSGFQEAEFYGAFLHYIRPSEIIPLDLIKYWKKAILPIDSPLAPRHAKAAAKIFPKGLLKYVSPSFIIIAKKAGKRQNEARIIQLFRKAGLLQKIKATNIKIVKSGGRPGKYHAAIFLICTENEAKPRFLCKICRNKKHVNILEDEANNLKIAGRLLADTELSSNIPKLLYFGTIDGITFLVTQFIEGDHSEFSPNIGMSKNNLKKLDESIQLGIKFLVKFQKYTQVKEVEVTRYLLPVIEKQREILKKRGQLTKEVDLHIEKLVEEIKTLRGLSVPICAVHGDYDFYYNILFDNSEVRVVDFEHFETEGLPFFDLATLIFNPILISYERLKMDIPLSSFINDLKSHIHEWLNLYAELSGVPKQILKIFAPIAALEQQTKEYPYYRDPHTYPMYRGKAFIELLSFK